MLHQVCPNKLDDAGVVVAVCEVVIERGEAMLLAGFLHAGQLLGFKFMAIDVSPIEGRRIHGEAGGHGSIGPDDDVVLPCTAIPLSEMQLSISVLDETRQSRDSLGDIAVGSGAVA